MAGADPNRRRRDGLILGLCSPHGLDACARDELGWIPRFSAAEALLELLEGLRQRAGAETPPLAPETGGPARVREILSGIGARD
jgi:hypothetical protein